MVLGIGKTEGCFVSIIRIDTNLPKSSFEVKLGEDGCTRELGKQCIYSGDWKLVISEEMIQRLIVND